MGTTTRGYPYPEDSDRVDVPGDMQAALDAVDSDVGGHVGDTTIHHTLGTGATDAATGNHTHSAGSITGLGKTVYGSGQAAIYVPANESEAYTDISFTGHQSYYLIAMALGGRGVYVIGNQALSTTAFRLTVWYDTAPTVAENRYVNWLLVGA